MDKEICTISIGGFGLDNDYTFYEDGKIRHFYDRNMYKLNLEEWVSPNEISDSDKSKILEKCSDSDRDYLNSIF